MNTRCTPRSSFILKRKGSRYETPARFALLPVSLFPPRQRYALRADLQTPHRSDDLHDWNDLFNAWSKSLTKTRFLSSLNL
jgi:hypothetical protein